MSEVIESTGNSSKKLEKSQFIRDKNPAIGSEVDQEEDYNPLVHRGRENLNSDSAVFMHLLKSTIGSGILFLPRALKDTGIISGAACSILITFLATYAAMTIVRCSQILCKRARVPSLDLGEVSRSSFEYGPNIVRRYSTRFKLATNLMVCFAEYQTVVIYILYVATSFQQIIQYFCAVSWDIRIYVIISAPFYCLVSLVPNLQYLTPFSVVGIIFLTAGFFVTLYYFFQDIKSPYRLTMYKNFFSIPVYCTIFLFAIHNMCLLMPLENSMKNPNHLPVILVISMVFNSCLYIFFAFFGYNKYDEPCDTVIKNLPLNQPAAQAVKVAITLSVMFSYGIHYFVPVSIIWPEIVEKVTVEKRRLYETVFRVGGVIVTVLVAIALPQLGPLLGFFSALCFSTMTLLLPGIIEMATKWQESNNQTILFTKNLAIFVVWIFLLVIGCFESVKQIIEDYGKTKAEDSIC